MADLQVPLPPANPGPVPPPNGARILPPQVVPVNAAPQQNLPQGNNNLTLEPRARTFLQFYQDTTKDPCQGDYGRIMQRFDPEHAASIAAEVLFEQAMGAGGTSHQAYFCCASTRRGPRVYTIHLPSRFVSALDGRTTPWDNSCYAFLGDVTQEVATTVVFPANAFQATPSTLVFTEDYLHANLNTLNGIDLFPAIPQNQAAAHAAHAAPVITRFLMYLPSRYAHHFLDSTGYTIKQVWQVLLPLLTQHQDLGHCQPLIKWLRVASHGTATHNAQGQPVMGPPCNAIHLVAPAADKDLIMHRNLALKLALPGIHQPSNGLESALYQMANAVAAQTSDQRLARETRANEALLPVLPSAKFRNTLPILMDFCQVHDELELPQLWHQWSNASKRQEFSILRELLDSYARGPEAFYHLAPVVSAKLVQDLLSFTFMGDSQDDLKSGLQPFMVADGSEEYRRANLELARTYGFLHDTDHGIMYADLQALEAKEVRSVPLNYFELEKSLGMFGNLLGVTLGTTHILTTAFRDFWELLTRGLRNDLQLVIDTTGRIKPAHILRSVQLQCYTWFNHRRARLAPPPPTFTTILHNIVLQSYINPHLPPALFKLAYPQSVTAISPKFVPGPPSVATTTATTTSTASADVSVLTTPTALTRATAPRGTFQSNLTPDSTLQSLVPGNIRLKDLIGTADPPLSDNNQPICLSFHLRQGCWSNCKRLSTHLKPLSNAEKQRVANFALAQMAARPTPSGGVSTPP